MSIYKIVQMVLRGATLILLLLSLYCNWEVSDLTTAPHFIMSGIFGGYSIITFGLLLEAGLDKNSDEFIEVTILTCGILFNLIASTLAFVEYYDPNTEIPSSAVSKAILAVVSATIYVIDIAFVYC